MILKKFTQQRLEKKDYDIDFDPWLSDMEDTLDNCAASVECIDDPTDTDLVVGVPLITASTVKIWVSGGTPGMTYKVTLNTDTVGGRKDESELIFVIEDI